MIDSLLAVLRDGAWFRLPFDGSLSQLQFALAPSVQLDTGVLAIEDLLEDLRGDVRSDGIRDCRFEMARGALRVRLANLQDDEIPGGFTVACFVGDLDAATTWEAPSSDEQKFSTEYGVVGIYDATRRDDVRLVLNRDPGVVDRILDKVAESGSAVLNDPRGGALMTVFKCGGGLGVYDVWRGLDSAGRPVCLVADMNAISEYEPADEPQE